MWLQELSRVVLQKYNEPMILLSHASNAITVMAAAAWRMIMVHANSANAAVCLIILAGMLGGFPATAMAAYDLKPFPEPEIGYRRVVIRLPVVDAPDDRRVELILGKTMEVDCNLHILSGQLARKVVQGWGYDYFVLGNVSGPASTMMACPPDEPRRAAFVRIGLGQNDAHNGWQRYNSKLPIVVYVPDSIEVHYRIWTADKQTATALSE
jgi:ecotin